MHLNSINRASALLDYFIGAQQQRLRNRQTECFRGLQVDHQFELGRLLYGKVRGLGALQNSVHVLRGVAVVRWEVSSVAEQPTRHYVIAQQIPDRQLSGLQKCLQPRAFGKVHAVRDHYDGLRSLSNNLLDRGAELRRCTGHNPQRNKIQRDTSALCASPEYGM